MDRSREQSQYFRSFVPEELRRCSSFRDYLRLFFGDKFGSLRLIDLATGNGRFPLVVARQKRSLGVVEIVASDKDLSFIEESGNKQRLERAGVVIERRDVEQVYKDEGLARVLWGDQVEELPDNQRYDAVCLNAPYVQGKNGFFDKALAYALHIVRPRGLIFISLNEVGGETIMDQNVPKKYPIHRMGRLQGYPLTDFTKVEPFTGKSCPVSVIVVER